MTNRITIIPYGSLKKEMTNAPRDRSEHVIDHPQPLSRFLGTIGIAVHRIQLVMVNHRAAGLNTVIGGGDRVALFPREYPIFVDWHTHRQAGP